MATPKKGWRRITVDGKQFRWMIRHEASYADNYAYANGAAVGIKFTVESASGGLLIINLARPRFDFWLNMSHPTSSKPVMPSEVADWIQRAIALDWNPEVKDKPLVLHE